jgi:hypothetical protein
MIGLDIATEGSLYDCQLYDVMTASWTTGSGSIQQSLSQSVHSVSFDVLPAMVSKQLV